VKKVIWIGSSYKDLKDFPPQVRQAMGHALHYAQLGKVHEHAKIFRHMGNANVQEIRENDRGGTYRVIYTVEMNDFIFVLHAFQKKSKSGLATPKQEIEMLNNRLREARVLYKSLIQEKK